MQAPLTHQAAYSSPVELVIAKLAEAGCSPKKGGTGWVARCPAHDDRNASLSVSAGHDGRALIFCHAACSRPAVVHALGLAMRDLFADAGTPGPRLARREWRERETTGPARDWGAIMAEFRAAMRADHEERLIQSLGPATSEVGIRALGVGWATREEAERRTGTQLRDDSWMMAMSDHEGRIVGINARSPSGAKITLRGGHLGLFLPGPDALKGLADPVLVAEGASDVISGLSCGLAVVGRASAMHGAELIARCAWLRDREIVVLGERDRSGTGERAAKTMAAKLAAAWGRPIAWKMPPERFKDLREFLTASRRAGGGGDAVSD